MAQSLGLLIGATVMDAKLSQTVAAVIMLTMMLARALASLHAGSFVVDRLQRHCACQPSLTPGFTKVLL